MKYTISRSASNQWAVTFRFYSESYLAWIESKHFFRTRALARQYVQDLKNGKA